MYLVHSENPVILSHKNTNRRRFSVDFLCPSLAQLSTNQGGGSMKDEQVRELLYQALETEIGGVQIYTTALRCAENEDLKEEWEEL